MYDDEIDLRSLDLGSLTHGDWETLMRNAARRARAERARVMNEMLRRLFGHLHGLPHWKNARRPAPSLGV